MRLTATRAKDGSATREKELPIDRFSPGDSDRTTQLTGGLAPMVLDAGNLTISLDGGLGAGARESRCAGSITPAAAPSSRSRMQAPDGWAASGRFLPCGLR
ncbi:MAG: hypothetical protein KGL48_11375 [Sphingomonadales bacterium]|nr:hypothetical protein [Sphingomonadales bacterium]